MTTSISNWIKVESSAIDAVAYCTAERSLEIMFRSGAVYAYLDVPREVFVLLLEAQSQGAFFNRQIRPTYRYEAVAARSPR